MTQTAGHTKNKHDTTSNKKTKYSTFLSLVDFYQRLTSQHFLSNCLHYFAIGQAYIRGKALIKK